MDRVFRVSDLAGLEPLVRLLASEDNKLILFYGNLGSGKTTFISGLCKELGVDSQVSSPTFSIVNEYRSVSGTIFHFDLYRIKDQDELFDLGFEEYLEQGALCLIEWPEVAEELLPEERVEVHITHTGGDSREVRILKIV